MKKTLKNVINAKVATLNQEVANLTLLKNKISEQMTKVQLGLVKAQAALLVLKQVQDEVSPNATKTDKS